ncbi:unnamed protein product [Cylicostephanus goldi]|uniref:Uncharacterized protein n=1 Tax=Cylicostephanus goldi TaxID=71465 RepID=A0A3P6S8E5_CYLGO|nr:unnamed protein product [Cylicostephanus goldi]
MRDDIVLLNAVFVLSLIGAVLSLGRTQSTAVEGILMCGQEPARQVLVKLYEHDTSE